MLHPLLDLRCALGQTANVVRIQWNRLRTQNWLSLIHLSNIEAFGNFPSDCPIVELWNVIHQHHHRVLQLHEFVAVSQHLCYYFWHGWHRVVVEKVVLATGPLSSFCGSSWQHVLWCRWGWGMGRQRWNVHVQARGWRWMRLRHHGWHMEMKSCSSDNTTLEPIMRVAVSKSGTSQVTNSHASTENVQKNSACANHTDIAN